MKIKITIKNMAKIDTLLDAVNGRATEHVFLDYNQIADIAKENDRHVLSILGSKKAAVGATLTETSGDKAGNRYKYARKATEITMERFPTGWFLTAVESVEIWPNQGGEWTLTLTAEQDAVAVAKLRERYSVGEMQ